MADIKGMNEEWEYYRQIVIPQNAPPVQLKTMREAFFAGAFVYATKVLQIVDVYDNDELAETRMEQLFKEVQAEVKKGLK